MYSVQSTPCSGCSTEYAVCSMRMPLYLFVFPDIKLRLLTQFAWLPWENTHFSDRTQARGKAYKRCDPPPLKLISVRDLFEIEFAQRPLSVSILVLHKQWQ